MENDVPEVLKIALDRVMAEQEAGRVYSLGELLDALHRDMSGDAADRTADAIIHALEFGVRPVVTGALAARRLELIGIITREQAATVVHKVAVRAHPDDPPFELTLSEAPSARLVAALAELERIDAGLL